MIERFAYSTRAARIVFGADALAQLPQELDRLGAGRAFLIATPGRKAEVEALGRVLGGRAAGSFTEARVHVPSETLARAAAALQPANADVLVAIGGGSAIGLAKALGRDRSLAIVAVPTTYSGSEMTDVWGTTSGEAKRTGRDPAVAPRVVLYDPQLTRSLPVRESAASGMNAIAHGVEALYAPDTSPVAALFANEALRLLAESLPAIVKSPGDLDARSQALLGAHFAGQALQLTTMGLQHRLCHALGGLGLSHALTHAVLLPHVVALKAPAEPRAMAAISRALGAADAAQGLHMLKQALGITERLRDIGMRQEQIDRVARTVKPAAGEESARFEGVVRGILQAAY